MAIRIISASVAIVAMGTATMTFPAEKVLDRSFDVPAGGRLRVDIDTGSIVVTGSDSQKVVVQLRAQGSEERLAKLSWSAERDGEGVAILAERDKSESWFGWRHDSSKISVTVQVPRAYNLDLKTSGGNIEVKQLEGRAVGTTSGGSISVESVRGETRMKTSGGGVKAHALRGPVELSTSGGSITATQIEGNLRAHTSGGGIRIEQTSGSIEAKTSGGSINIDLAGRNDGIFAKTSGGSVTLRLPKATNGLLTASTSGGSVSSDLPMVHSEVSSSSLKGTINEGGPEIVARSSGGSVRVSSRD